MSGRIWNATWHAILLNVPYFCHIIFSCALGQKKYWSRGFKFKLSLCAFKNVHSSSEQILEGWLDQDCSAAGLYSTALPPCQPHTSLGLGRDASAQGVLHAKIYALQSYFSRNGRILFWLR